MTVISDRPGKLVGDENFGFLEKFESFESEIRVFEGGRMVLCGELGVVEKIVCDLCEYRNRTGQFLTIAETRTEAHPRVMVLGRPLKRLKVDDVDSELTCV